AGGRHEPGRGGAVGGPHPGPAPAVWRHHPAHRAPDEDGYEHLRTLDGAGLWPGHRRRAARGDPHQPAGARSVPGARGDLGMSETRSKAPAGAPAEATAVQAAAGEPILTLEDVHVYYGNIRAVRGISMEVRRGEIVTLIGANGAGKTTTLRAISRLVPIAQGRITFRGQDLARFPAHEVVRLGICHVPEGRGVFANLTVRENLLLATYSRRGKGDIEQDLERVYSVFPRLAERRNQYAGTLSGGEQQMLAVGRALMTGGELMLLDEPSMGLAPI